MLLIYYITNLQEHYTECKFIPWGPDINYCMNQCENSSIRSLFDNKDKTFCDKTTCYNKCYYCDNSKRCQWITEYKTPPANNLIQNLDLKLLDFSYENDTLTWNNISSDNIINMYIIQFSRNDESNKVNLIYTESTTHNLTSDKLIKTNNNIFLERNTEYIFIIYGLFENKLLYMSNPKIIKL